MEYSKCSTHVQDSNNSNMIQTNNEQNQQKLYDEKQNYSYQTTNSSSLNQLLQNNQNIPFSNTQMRPLSNYNMSFNNWNNQMAQNDTNRMYYSHYSEIYPQNLNDVNNMYKNTKKPDSIDSTEFNSDQNKLSSDVTKDSLEKSNNSENKSNCESRDSPKTKLTESTSSVSKVDTNSSSYAVNTTSSVGSSSTSSASDVNNSIAKSNDYPNNGVCYNYDKTGLQFNKASYDTTNYNMMMHQANSMYYSQMRYPSPQQSPGNPNRPNMTFPNFGYQQTSSPNPNYLYHNNTMPQIRPFNNTNSNYPMSRGAQSPYPSQDNFINGSINSNKDGKDDTNNNNTNQECSSVGSISNKSANIRSSSKSKNNSKNESHPATPGSNNVASPSQTSISSILDENDDSVSSVGATTGNTNNESAGVIAAPSSSANSTISNTSIQQQQPQMMPHPSHQFAPPQLMYPQQVNSPYAQQHLGPHHPVHQFHPAAHHQFNPYVGGLPPHMMMPTGGPPRGNLPPPYQTGPGGQLLIPGQQQQVPQQQSPRFHSPNDAHHLHHHATGSSSGSSGLQHNNNSSVYQKLIELGPEPDRPPWVERYLRFMHDNNTPLSAVPTVVKQPLDIYRLYHAVRERGGLLNVVKSKRWKEICLIVNVNASASGAYTLRRNYIKCLLDFECKFDRGGADSAPILQEIQNLSDKKKKNTASAGANSRASASSPSTLSSCNSDYPMSSAGSTPHRAPTTSVGPPNVSPHEFNTTFNSPVANPVNISSCVSTAASTSSNSGLTNGASCGNLSPALHQQQRSPFPYNNNSNSANLSGTNAALSNRPNYPGQFSSQQMSGISTTSNASTTLASSSAASTLSSNAAMTSAPGSNTTPPPRGVNYPPTTSPMMQQQMMRYDSQQQQSNAQAAQWNKQWTSNTNSSNNNNTIPNHLSPQQMPISPNTSAGPVSSTGYDLIASSSSASAISSNALPSTNSRNNRMDWKYGGMPPPPPPGPNMPNVAVATSNAASMSSGSSSRPPQITPPPPQSQPNSNMPAMPPYPNGPPMPSPHPHLHSNYPPPPTFSQYPPPPHMHPYPPIPQPPQSTRFMNAPPQLQHQMLQQQQQPSSSSSTSNSILPMSSAPSNNHRIGGTSSASSMIPSQDPSVGGYHHMNSHQHHIHQQHQQHQQHHHQQLHHNKLSTGPGGTSSHLQASSSSVSNSNSYNSVVAATSSSTINGAMQYSNRSHQIEHNNKLSQQYSFTFNKANNQYFKRYDSLFPPDTVEATQPDLSRKRRLCSKDIKPFNPTQITMSLKSGLITETSCALNYLNIWTRDDNIMDKLNLKNLMPLFQALLDLWRHSLGLVFGEDKFIKDLELPVILDDSLESVGYKLPVNSESIGTGSNKQHQIFHWVLKKISQVLGDYQHNQSVKVEQLVCDFKSSTNNSSSNNTKNGMVHKNVVRLEIIRDQINELLTGTKYIQDRRGLTVKLDENNHLDELNWSDNKQLLEFIVETSCRAIGADSAVTQSGGLSQTKLEEDDGEELAEIEQDSQRSMGEIWMRGGGDTTRFVVPPILSQASFVDDNNNSVKTVYGPPQIKRCKLLSHNEGQTSNCVSPAPPNLQQEIVASALDCHSESLQPEQFYKMQAKSEIVNDGEQLLFLLCESDEEKIHRCLSITNVLRNLSFLCGNERVMAANRSLLVLLGRLMLIGHEHSDGSGDGWPSDDEGAWWAHTGAPGTSFLDDLREHALVLLVNISSYIELATHHQSIVIPLVSGVVHWLTCKSTAAAEDPLPSHRVLGCRRLALETLMRLCVHETNVDFILNSPHTAALIDYLASCFVYPEVQVVKEMSLAVMHYLSMGGDNGLGSYYLAHAKPSIITGIINFIEITESQIRHVVENMGMEALQARPELMGTSLEFLRHSGALLNRLSQYPANLQQFTRDHEMRMLNLVISTVLDQTVAQSISGVLFLLTNDCTGTSTVGTTVPTSSIITPSNHISCSSNKSNLINQSTEENAESSSSFTVTSSTAAATSESAVTTVTNTNGSSSTATAAAIQAISYTSTPTSSSCSAISSEAPTEITAVNSSTSTCAFKSFLTFNDLSFCEDTNDQQHTTTSASSNDDPSSSTSVVTGSAIA